MESAKQEEKKVSGAEKETASGQSQKEKEQAYRQHVEQTTPKYSMSVRMAKAFITGGIICVIGQCILNYATNAMGLDKETAGSWCSMLLVLLSVVFTGFANSVASAAIEYQKEGQVYGIGCKIFTIAGPVILYGIFTSWVLGLLYWIGKMMGIL